MPHANHHHQVQQPCHPRKNIRQEDDDDDDENEEEKVNDVEHTKVGKNRFNKKLKPSNTNDDDNTNNTLEELAKTAWAHFCNFLGDIDDDDDENDVDKEETKRNQSNTNECNRKDNRGGTSCDGDVDELEEIIHILQPHVHYKPITEQQQKQCHFSFDYFQDKTNNTTIVSLLPVLMSVAYYHLATMNIEQYILLFQQQNDNNNTNHNKVLELLLHKIIEQMTCSLQYFPWNAAMWSMGANFLRCTLQQQQQQQQHQQQSHTTTAISNRFVCQWYECAAICAKQVRTIALQLLLQDNDDDDDDQPNDKKNSKQHKRSNDASDDDENDESENEEVKGWIEILLLQQVAGVEWSNDGADDENDDNDDDKQQEKQEDDGSFTFSTVEATARFMAATLHSTEGRHDQALLHLARFGDEFTHRLHPHVWSGTTSVIDNNTELIQPQSGTQMLQASPSPPTCFGPNVLPMPLYERLCQVFAPNSNYFQESNYGNRGYYSFFMDYYEPHYRPPQNLIEDVIVNYLLPLAQQQQLASAAATEGRQATRAATTSTSSSNSIVGYEWWVHTRPIQANLGHNLHFDTEESFLEHCGQITHPIVSSVLYLTGNATTTNNNEVNNSGGTSNKANVDRSFQQQHAPAGATIVLDQAPDSQQVAQVCWRNSPQDNTFLVFPGNLLHGVLPCPGPIVCTPTPTTTSIGQPSTADNNNNGTNHDDPLGLLQQWKEKLALTDNVTAESVSTTVAVTPQHRLTFLVGFWTRRVPDDMKERRLYGPCGPLPSATEAKWVEEIYHGYNSDDFPTGSKDRNNGNAAATNSTPNNGTTKETKSLFVPLITPAWEELPNESDSTENDPPLQLPRAIDHRFFVKNPQKCFRDSLFEKD